MSEERGTGRTTRMLFDVVRCCLDAEGEKAIVVVAHTHGYARDLMRKLLSMGFGKTVAPSLMELNGHTIEFISVSDPKGTRGIPKENIFYDHYAYSMDAHNR